MAGLTVAQLREHVTTSLVDAAIQRLLDAAWQAITTRAGAAAASVVDVRTGGTGLLQLSRRAATITKVEEIFTLGPGEPEDLRALVLAGDIWWQSVTLATDDYALDASGFWLQRLADGTYPSDAWGQAVRVTYASFDDTAERLRVQLELVRLDLDWHPGIASESIGTWSETYVTGDAGYQLAREQILASLGPRPWRFA